MTSSESHDSDDGDSSDDASDMGHAYIQVFMLAGTSHRTIIAARNIVYGLFLDAT
jgi:hypothetical protein